MNKSNTAIVGFLLSRQVFSLQLTLWISKIVLFLCKYYRTGQLIAFSRPFVIFFSFSKLMTAQFILNSHTYFLYFPLLTLVVMPKQPWFVLVYHLFVAVSTLAVISPFVKQAYFAYSKQELGDQDNSWVPQKVCKHCVESLRMWTKKHVISWHLVYLWFGESQRIIA